MNKNTQHNQLGFSMVELAIVLVISAFIVAAIVLSGDVFRKTRILSIIKDVEEFKTVASNFQNKYQSLPGDMPDATEYWAGTADGDDDGQIEAGAEALRAWQHISLANMAKYSYAGTGAFDPGVNIPTTEVDLAGGFLIQLDTVHSRTDNTIIFATVRLGNLDGSIVSPQEAWAMDEKADDGIANSGLIMARDGGATGAPLCLTGGDDYLMTNDEIKCQMNFWFEAE